MNRPKTLDNTDVRVFLEDFYCASDACECCPELDDIFSGVLELKSPGDTSTRSLSRQVLFHILQWCDSIDVASIREVTRDVYAYPTMARYAAAARVASMAIHRIHTRWSEDGLTVAASSWGSRFHQGISNF